MPSGRKKRIKERMQKTGESYATAAMHETRYGGVHGRYGGTPELGPTAEWYDEKGEPRPDSESRPQIEMVNIQGKFDSEDLKKAWVPESAFDDPTMKKDPRWPEGVKRVLTLDECIDERRKQTGWRLERLQPGPFFMGMVVVVYIQWSRGDDAKEGAS